MTEVDGGDVILQSAVDIHGDDTVETLKDRVLDAELALYPKALAMAANSRQTP
ncbi:MAG: formyltransferase family protein [Pseudomonadota bacterium]